MQKEINIQSEINNKKYIRTNKMSNYFYFDANICCELEPEKFVNLQTGHLYHMNDYSLPSNELSIYPTDDFSTMCEKLYTESCFDDDISQEFCDKINRRFELSYTVDELTELLNKLQIAFEQAKDMIIAAEEEAEEEFEKDNLIYIRQDFVEVYDEEYNAKRHYAEPEILSFDDESEADLYIDTHDYSYIITKEEAYNLREL